MTSPTAKLDTLRTVTNTSRSELGTDDEEVRRGGTLEGLCTGRASEEDRSDENEGHNNGEGPLVPPVVPSSSVVADSPGRLIVEVALLLWALLPLLILQQPLLLPLAERRRGRERMAPQLSSSVGSPPAQQRIQLPRYVAPVTSVSRSRGVPLDKKACL